MKQIRFSNHAKIQMELRGASEKEIIAAINSGKWEPAKMGKFQTKHRFEFDNVALINQKFYSHKTVAPVFADEDSAIVVITVKVYYSNEEVR